MVDPMVDKPSAQFTPEELQQWQARIAAANRNNVLCHCRGWDREWLASAAVPCECGSRNVETIRLLAIPQWLNGNMIGLEWRIENR